MSRLFHAMPSTTTSPAFRAAAAATCLALGAAAFAGERVAATPLLPTYRQECSSCHVPYPPGMLPAVSWQRLLGHLPQHFGVDASLDAATLRELTVWLEAHASTSPRTIRPPAQDRITRTDWFMREHDELPAATWKLPAVKSPSNCAACHLQADQGDFNEHHVRIPR